MANKAKHTPGPWHADSIDRVRTQTGIVIARCERNEHHEYMDGREQSANARLIAAAPEMLEALKDMFWQFEHNGDEAPEDKVVLDQAAKIIAKAEGSK